MIGAFHEAHGMELAHLSALSATNRNDIPGARLAVIL
jgi:hypothetical protein